MKFLFGLFVSLFLCLGLSAGNSRTLEWFTNTETGKSMPDFEGSVHFGNAVIPGFFETQIPETPANAFTARLIYPVFQKIKSDELNQLKPYLNLISDSIVIDISLGIQSKKQVVDLTFIPFIRKGNSYYKLISFDWDIKPVISGLRAAYVPKSITPTATFSVLKTGTWKKISVTQSGIYKLTYSDIKGMGIDPDHVQIYGYGGALLEEDFKLGGYLDDLPAVAVWRELGADSVFNNGDYILFYAKGPISWAAYNTSSPFFSRVRNHYSDKACYFVGERSEGTKTSKLSAITGLSNVDVTSFTDFLLHESERVNVGESVENIGTGRQLYGEDFTTNPTQRFTFEVPNPDLTEDSRLMVEFIARNSEASSCKISVNNTTLPLTLNFAAFSTTNDHFYASSDNKVQSFRPTGETVTVGLNYIPKGTLSSHRAYLNYIILNVRRLLKMTGSSLVFRDPKNVASGNIAHYTIQIENENAKPLVFDVTNPKEMLLMRQMKGTQNTKNYEFTDSASTLHEYVCVDLNGSFPKPTIEGNVVNQNIHGHSQVDMVIISPPEYISYANTLAQAHRDHDNLRVMVVTPEQVYNEFSSGTPDATAYRRMMKLFYDRGTSALNDLPKYLLLFGDGVYDNRLVSTMFANSSSKPNKILTYQSVESLDAYKSYVSDDYFGFLENTDGANLATAKMVIGIGRFPVSTAEQANIAVKKTISYMQNARKGAWKNQLLFLADDGDDHKHVSQADSMASTVGRAHPEFIINKIYVDAYSKVSTASGPTVPDANNRFSELLNSGLLMLNYTGHGSTTEWALEKLLTVPQIQAMTNKCLPLWVTATCDFTRYDAPDYSGGEYIFLNPNGGGVALFTTSRVVYSDRNFTINQSFFNNIFTRKNGIRNSLGDIMNLSKQSTMLNGDDNKLKFTLIGDPALRLAYPEYSTKVTRINGKDVTTAVDTIHALSRVSVSGRILDKDGNWAEHFNGIIYPTILDAKEVLTSWTTTLSNGKILTTNLYDRSKVLFSGKDSVVNGCFDFTFVVPKDISYSSETGRINLYAYQENGENEAQGYFDNFVMVGTDTSVKVNNTGPKIELYLNDQSFVSGDEVNETPTFIARIADENGLNTSGSGIGHDMMLSLDHSSTMNYKLNSYFSAEIGSDTSGIVQYILPELSAGKHHLSFKAWDVQNNSNIDSVWFVVKPGMSPSVSNLKYAQQGENAWFTFIHDRPDIDMSVKMTIYDLLGRPFWSATWDMQASKNVSDRFNWNLTDTNGRRVPNGIYLCKILVTDSNGAQTIGNKKIRVAAQ